LAMRRLWSSREPCEKFNRMMFIPALRKAVMASTDEVFAPIVQMIAVCRNWEGRLYTSSLEACSSAEVASWLTSCRTVQALEPRFLLSTGMVSLVALVAPVVLVARWRARCRRARRDTKSKCALEVT